MPAMIAATVSVVQPRTPDRIHDKPACILAALIDGLTSPQRYSVQVRNGELFIEPARRRNGAHPAGMAASGFSGR
jgi:hypothetical protein